MTGTTNHKTDVEGWLAGVGIVIALCLMSITIHSCLSDQVEIRQCREAFINLKGSSIQQVAIHDWNYADRGALLATITEPEALAKFAVSIANLKQANPVKPVISQKVAIVVTLDDGSEIELDAGIAWKPHELIRFSLVERGKPGDGYQLKFCGSFESVALFSWLSEQMVISARKFQ